MTNQSTPGDVFAHLLRYNTPSALAWVKGSEAVPALSGFVKFYETPYQGVLVEAELFNLPNKSVPGSSDFYAFHIHQNSDCSRNFAHTGEHYNPTVRPHPFHAGDFPPLLGNEGYAWTAFYDKRFSVKDIVGRSVIIHNHADDFMTQPSGDSGSKIGCGVIEMMH